MGRPLAAASRRHFIREWRIHRDLSQEQVAEKLDVSKATISRIETGAQPYSQRILEGLANVFDTEPASLLIPPSGDAEALWSIWRQAQPSERRQMTEMARIIVKAATAG